MMRKHSSSPQDTVSTKMVDAADLLPEPGQRPWRELAEWVSDQCLQASRCVSSSGAHITSYLTAVRGMKDRKSVTVAQTRRHLTPRDEAKCYEVLDDGFIVSMYEM